MRRRRRMKSVNSTFQTQHQQNEMQIPTEMHMSFEVLTAVSMESIPLSEMWHRVV
jgi:hypothetical protein